MERTLVCDICQQAWDESEGEECTRCGRMGKPSDEVFSDLSMEVMAIRSKRRQRPRDYIQLTVKDKHLFALHLILHEEVMRVSDISESERTNNDKDILACAEDLLSRLKKPRKRYTSRR